MAKKEIICRFDMGNSTMPSSIEFPTLVDILGFKVGSSDYMQSAFILGLNNNFNTKLVTTTGEISPLPNSYDYCLLPSGVFTPINFQCNKIEFTLYKPDLMMVDMNTILSVIYES